LGNHQKLHNNYCASREAFVKEDYFRRAGRVTIFVGNLSFQATDDQVRSAFSPFGQVTEARVIRDRDTGRAHGFALVEMPDLQEASRAVAGVNGKPIADRVVRVCEARPREDGPKI
jgi:RNA recognition motif-containing protein